MWVLFSVLAGLADSLRDASSKVVAKEVSLIIIAWSYSLFSLPFFLPYLFQGPESAIPVKFWVYLIFDCSCHVLGGIMLARALSRSDLSLCAPMVAFTPLFLLVVGPLMTGEMPRISGIAGGLLVVFGSYLLNIFRFKQGIFAPFRALLNDTGPRIMLGLAAMWSVTGSIDKIAAPICGRNFWAACQILTITIFFLPIVIYRREVIATFRVRTLRGLIPVGIFNALSLSLYLKALAVAPVYYVICLKRLSILFSLVIGKFFFSELVTKDRSLGAVVMLIGVFVISLWG